MTSTEVAGQVGDVFRAVGCIRFSASGRSERSNEASSANRAGDPEIGECYAAEMKNKNRLFKIAGHVLICLVGVVLILAGALKIINVGADDMLEGLANARLMQHKTLISVTAIVCGLLLLVPRIWPLGVLMATAYWGGAIVAHMTYNDSVIMPASFLGLLWVGVGLATLGTSASRR